MGLCDSELLHGNERYLAGPVHPAMGELTRAVIYRRAIENALDDMPGSGMVTVEVAKGRISAAVGQSAENRKYFEKKLGRNNIKFVENGSIIGYNIKVYRT